MVFFLIPGLFLKRKKRAKFKKAIAIKTILQTKSDLKIDNEKISLMMGKNCHLVIYPLNKDKELNFVCIVRDKKYDPDNIQSLINRVVAQNSNLKKLLKVI